MSPQRTLLIAVLAAGVIGALGLRSAKTLDGCSLDYDQVPETVTVFRRATWFGLPYGDCVPDGKLAAEARYGDCADTVDVSAGKAWYAYAPVVEIDGEEYRLGECRSDGRYALLEQEERNCEHLSTSEIGPQPYRLIYRDVFGREVTVQGCRTWTQ
tara:strand:+ start:1795 stop:2262 length:468 start_codon:yes stop_codon:yes gene_type:complete